MGAKMDQVEAYFVFTSKQQMEQAFAVFDKDPDYKDYKEYFNFVNLNDTYLFVNDPNNYPYTVITMMEGYFSELMAHGYWGQYFLRSAEVDIDESNSEPLVKGLQLIEPHQDYTNIPGFSDYFTPVPGWKKFTGTDTSFKISLVIKQIEGKEYFYYEDPGQSDYLPWVLNDVLLHIEDNKIYSVTNASVVNPIQETDNFSNGSYMKEIFANTWEGFKGCSYIMSEECGFRLNQYKGLEQNMVLNGINIGECLVFLHDYIHVNCYSYDASHTEPFEHYLCKDVVYYSYWQKDKGLAGVAMVKEKVRTEFICTELPAGELGKGLFTENKQGPEAIAAKQEPEEKKGFWNKLFSKK